MPYLFTILFKINLVLLLFAGAYYLVLRKLTFYDLNRIFLVFGILFSSAYPLIDLTDFYHRQSLPALVPRINRDLAELARQASYADHWRVLTVVLYLGILVMGVKLITQFFSLYRMHQNSLPGKFGNHKIRILKDKVAPFSFWQTIYVNPSMHNRDDLNNIIRHEKVHVEEWHTLDIILAEINLVFYWFNPGVWLMKKAVRENIEYITDQKMLKKGLDRKAYQYSLLNVGVLATPVQIVNRFTLSDLKKRIKMMNSPRSSVLNLSRYLLVLPVLLLLSLAFTIAQKDTSRGTRELPVIVRKRADKAQFPSITPDSLLKRKVIIHRQFIIDDAPTSPQERQKKRSRSVFYVDKLPDRFHEGLPGSKRIKILVPDSADAVVRKGERLAFNDTTKRKFKKFFIRMREPSALTGTENPGVPDVLKTIKEELNVSELAGRRDKLFFNGEEITMGELERKLDYRQLTRVLMNKDAVYITTGDF